MATEKLTYLDTEILANSEGQDWSKYLFIFYYDINNNIGIEFEIDLIMN